MNNFKQKALIFAAASILAVTAPRIANARNAYFQNKKNADVPALYAPASAAKTKSAKDSTVESAFSKRLAKAKEVLMSYPEITSIPGIEASMEKPVGKCILLEFERMNCRKRLVKEHENRR
ncbi:MAG: hypothetical protein NT051_01715 [Candidatus Micrarchaeota archaeon]|nr:hypothetical protein [Candidatus Micrarchaeota archaeon]